MKKIIYKHGDNEVAIVNMVNDNTSLESIIDKVVPAEHEWSIIDESEIPLDRTFRDAWTFNKQTIVVDIDKAKEIQKNKFRAARMSILEKLDVQYMKADEQGNTDLKQQIAAQKQELRDVTNTPLPDDLEGIKNTWPSILDL